MSAADGFEELVAIVEHGSVTAAARALDLPRPTVSRRLGRLEERLGVRLLHRTTRRMKLSRQGEILYPKARQVVSAAREAEADVRRLDGVPRGRLRISVPVGLPPIFAQWIASFLAKYREVEVEVVGSAEHVDLLAEGFDVAMRRGPMSDRSLITRTLSTDKSLAVASPAYLAREGTPKSAADLEHHDCVVGFTGSGVAEHHWPLLDGGVVAVSGRIRTNDMRLRAEAAKIDRGIALLSERVVAEDLDTGALVQVLEGIVGRTERVNLVYLDREHLDPKIRAFVDHIVERLAVARGESDGGGD